MEAWPFLSDFILAVSDGGSTEDVGLRKPPKVRKEPAKASMVVQDDYLATQVAIEIHNLQSKKERKRPIYKSNKVHTCEICSKTFATPSFLRRHIVVHTGEKPFACPFCDKRYTQVEHLRRHKGTHTGENVFTCSVCQKKFLEKTRYTDHMLSHLDERPYECNICQKGFTDRVGLQKHHKIHIGEKKYECDVCHKRFIERQTLKIHQRIHTGEHPHKCKFCGKGFNREKLLEIHMRSHYGDRPFQCEVCFKKFSTKKCFINHGKLHTKDTTTPVELPKLVPEPVVKKVVMEQKSPKFVGPQYQCKICSRSFERKCSLTVHTKAMHGNAGGEILNVKCGACGMVFPTLDLAREHMKIHENEESLANPAIDQAVGDPASASVGGEQGQLSGEGVGTGVSTLVSTAEPVVISPVIQNVHVESEIDAGTSVSVSMGDATGGFHQNTQTGQPFHQSYSVGRPIGYYVENLQSSAVGMPANPQHERFEGQRMENDGQGMEIDAVHHQVGIHTAYNATNTPVQPGTEAHGVVYQQQSPIEMISARGMNPQIEFIGNRVALDSTGQISYTENRSLDTRSVGGTYALQFEYRDGGALNPSSEQSMKVVHEQQGFSAGTSVLLQGPVQTQAVEVGHLEYTMETRPSDNWRRDCDGQPAPVTEQIPRNNWRQDPSDGQPAPVTEHRTIQTANWMADFNALQQMETNEIAAAMTNLAQWPPTDFQMARGEILVAIVSDNTDIAVENREGSLDTAGTTDGIKGLIKKSIQSQQKETGTDVPDRSSSFAPRKLLNEYMPPKRKRRRSI